MVYHARNKYILFYICAFCENNKPQIATHFASVLIWLYIAKSGKVKEPFQKRHFARTDYYSISPLAESNIFVQPQYRVCGNFYLSF